MPTISTTLKAMRQRISRSKSDLVTGLATGGSSTTLTATGEIALRAAGSLQGAEISIVAGTASVVTRRVSAHTVASGVATLTAGAGSTTWTTPDATSEYEIHMLNGRGWSKAQYDDAINAAIDSQADFQTTDLDDVSLAAELGYGAGVSNIGLRRNEYPIPASFNYVNEVWFLAGSPATRHPTGSLTSFRAVGNATASRRVGQGFKVPQAGFYQYFSIYMKKQAAPTDNWTLQIETDTAGLPSGTLVTGGTSGTVAGSLLHVQSRFVVFTMASPVYLSANTQYHWTLQRASDTVDATNYLWVGEDTAGGYGDGTASIWNTTWGAIAGSPDFIFAVSPAGVSWVRLAPANIEYVGTTAAALRFKKLPVEGTPIRLVGRGAIARVSAETDAIPIDPDYCERYATTYLESQLAGYSRADNHNQAMQAALQGLALLPQRRMLPAANSIRVR